VYKRQAQVLQELLAQLAQLAQPEPLELVVLQDKLALMLKKYVLQ
jgi:hypothetical protein